MKTEDETSNITQTDANTASLEELKEAARMYDRLVTVYKEKRDETINR